MFKKLLLTFAIGCALVSLTNAQDEHLINPIPLTGQLGDEITTIVYDPGQGLWWTEHPESLRKLTTFELTSSEDFFTESPLPDWLGGNFDIYHSKKAFKLEPAGFGSLNPAGAKPALTGTQVSQLLTVVGSFAGGGALTPVDLMVIPEPSSIVLFFIGGLSLLRLRRRFT